METFSVLLALCESKLRCVYVFVFLILSYLFMYA